MRRIKWLLLRLKHLRDGRADWIVKIVDEGTPPRRCFAHSIPPKVEPNAGIMGEPPVWAMPVSPPCLPVPPPVAPDVIAVMLATGRPLEMVEAALAVMPEGADPVAWVNAQTVTMLSGGQMAIIHASEVSP
ncbi:hypothetical protein LBMAG42_57040 [Deltaproteobacteria bacterium]|nr:hypothetical protein LBMAG42_57040 [Deltaproteobacteria bacterium]